MSFKPRRKAVFPVGGLSTRFIPATKAKPKEMLPVVDRPLIQYTVEKAMEAGIEQMIFTGRGKSAIEDHFDIACELESTMSERGKSLSVLDATRLNPGQIAYVRQQEPMGLGDAVWRARHIVGDEPFAVLLADDQTDKYGVITPGSRDGALTEVRGLVEKPKPGTPPSNFAVIGRYVLQPEVMRVLETQEAGAGSEIQLTDAMARMIGDQPFHGVTFDGVRYDRGDQAGFLQANIAVAVEREDIGAAVRDFARAVSA